MLRLKWSHRGWTAQAASRSVLAGSLAPADVPTATARAAPFTVVIAGAWLTFLTEAAAGPAEGEIDPIGAAVWGLVRSAQAEHPGRFALLDVDRD